MQWYPMSWSLSHMDEVWCCCKLSCICSTHEGWVSNEDSHQSWSAFCSSCWRLFNFNCTSWYNFVCAFPKWLFFGLYLQVVFLEIQLAVVTFTKVNLMRDLTRACRVMTVPSLNAYSRILCMKDSINILTCAGVWSDLYCKKMWKCLI